MSTYQISNDQLSVSHDAFSALRIHISHDSYITLKKSDVYIMKERGEMQIKVKVLSNKTQTPFRIKHDESQCC